MCNNLHEEGFRPIPKRGVGWKIFGINVVPPADCDTMIITSIHGVAFKRADDGWVEWKWNDVDERHRGFCFFLKQRDAIDGARKWCQSIDYYGCKPYKTYIVLKIEYDQGLGECNESNFIEGEVVRIALAKRFRIIGVDGRR